ncbi:hypothetical protein [Aquisphaera insulae]|uniref:hypothetical protein n=1 Tax=Aquisphaera insulae TaxID=2712864 RepID=UPI0013ED7FDE|nr:hypothetical protein [Aquisphaera insulae]
MTLRLVLVSLVAALGLTIPGAARLESWVASTQNWMNARFADWDTRHPLDADYVIVSNNRDAGRPAAAVPTSPAPIATPAPASDGPAPRQASPRLASRPVTDRSPATAEAFHVVFRPAQLVRKSAPVPPAAVVRLARWELDRDHDGRPVALGVKPPVVRRPEKPAARVDFLAVGRSFRDRVRVAMTESMSRAPISKAKSNPPRVAPRPVNGLKVCETLLGGPARRVAATPAARTGAKTTPSVKETVKLAASNPGFGAMEKGANLYFAGNLQPIVRKTQPTPSTEPVRIATTPAPPKPTPKAEPVKSELPKIVFAELPKSVFAELPKVSNDLDPELDGLAMTSEDGFGTFAVRSQGVPSRGLALVPVAGRPSAPTVHPTIPPPSTEVTRAVRLTREAVYAWVNVFTGPAVVTVAPSRDTATR